MNTSEQWPTEEDVLRLSNEHKHEMCPACRTLDRMGTMPTLALCLICAYVKPPGVWSAVTRTAVCIDCRDKAQFVGSRLPTWQLPRGHGDKMRE